MFVEFWVKKREKKSRRKSETILFYKMGDFSIPARRRCNALFLLFYYFVEFSAFLVYFI